MKHLLLLILVTYSVTLWQQSVAQTAAQSPAPLVELIEDKQEKRWNLYAQNNTDEEQEAFLVVQGEGFRRSADRPVIKKIPPNSKVLMITLIPLKGATPSYETIFTYENRLQNIHTRKGKHREEKTHIRPLNPDELTIFIDENCDKCAALKAYLIKNRIKHRTLELNKNSKVRDFMWDHLKDTVADAALVKLPVLLKGGQKYFDIRNMDYFLQNHDW